MDEIVDIVFGEANSKLTHLRIDNVAERHDIPFTVGKLKCGIVDGIHEIVNIRRCKMRPDTGNKARRQRSNRQHNREQHRQQCK